MSRIKINIIQFIRGFEPREPVDLLLPVQKQLELLDIYKLKGTFLLQYDALIDDRYVKLLKAYDSQRVEIGLWLEVVQPQVEAVGLSWNGRFPWDWHAHCGFLLGYTPEQRRLLIDEAFRAFRERFGYYPTAVGCWMIDTYSLQYIVDTYHIEAACICREQWGMDGYTLWGGYFSGGYYPSRHNMLCPAETVENRIDVPVFRMSGSDPIYDYDIDLDFPKIKKDFALPLLTLEACCRDAGASPKWLSWITSVYGSDTSFPFGYMNLGQENSFGWDYMCPGIKLQFALAAELMCKDEADVQTLSETGRWFRNTFPETPATTLHAGNDWRGEGRQTMWYQSPYYRTNLFFENGCLWLRDLHFYHGQYQERYLTTADEENTFLYDSLPFTEGRLWSRADFRAGLYLCDSNGNALTGLPPCVQTEGETSIVTWETGIGQVVLNLSSEMLTVTFCDPRCFIKNTWLTDGEEPVPFQSCNGRYINACHNKFDYRIELETGIPELLENCLLLRPNDDGILRLNCRCVRQGG